MQAGFTKTVGLELAQQGNITCNAICPGYVLTDLIRNQLEATSKARGIPKVRLTVQESHCAYDLVLLQQDELLMEEQRKHEYLGERCLQVYLISKE